MTSLASNPTGLIPRESPPTEAERVEAWRLEQLLAAGYPLVAADQLARCTDVDLHQATALVEGGCPTDLALRILA